MPTVLDLFENLTALDVAREAKKAIASTASVIADLNREQMLHGKRADGSTMPNYAPASVKYYGKPQGPIMLFDKGAFQASLQVDVSEDYFEVIATDLYDLEERFGGEIYGLGDTQQQYYNQDVFLPEFGKSIEDLTGLDMNL